ncbi:hypothetical protein [Promicromonospora sukumoe]|uniref:hypothetical protein n=1 Tax=Promicromonospora sukumoe TaxID=88382 RepID=UPI00364E0ECB
MPSPVSPDAGVPEHQPDPRPHQFQPGQRSGQFQPGQLQPRTGQFPARPDPLQHPPGRRPGAEPGRGEPRRGEPGTGDSGGRQGGEPGGKPGRKGRGRRDRIWSVVAFAVAAGVIVAVGIHFFGPDRTEEVAAAAWAVESCAGPEPSPTATDGAGTYRPLSCDDAEATVSILDIQDAVSVAQLHCPAGTDVVFQKDGQAGGNTQAVCARNLSDDHPGDPGKGGGQLVAGDCVDDQGSELACASDGARKVTALIVSGMQCPKGTADKLELGFDASRSFETICLGG